MKEIIITLPNPEKLVRLFSTDESVGLYFERNWGHGLKIKDLQFEPSFACYDINEGSTKKCQLFRGEEIIDFDHFQPKNNLEYYIYAKGEDQISYYFFEETQSYSNCRKVAVALAQEGKEVLISEEFCKLKNIVYNKNEEFHPFDERPTQRSIFFVHSRSNTFSNLITEEEEKQITMQDIESWYASGHSNINIYKRVAYFQLGELKKFCSPNKESTFSVISKMGESDSFKSYDLAVAFCKEQNKKGEAGCELLICENMHSMSWH